MIKLIAFDVYGTILATEDPDNGLRARKGFFELVKKCQELGITIVTISDNSIDLTRIDLEDSRVPLDIFTAFYKMEKGVPKDLSEIFTIYEVQPKEVLVFGDKPDIDIALAKEMGCQTILVPEYVGYGDQFDIMSIKDLPESLT